MNTLLAYLEVLTDAGGYLVLAGVYLAILAALVAWQVYEFRRLWVHSAWTWWVIKLATPATAILFILLSLPLTGNAGEFAGLAAMYFGLFLWLVGGPILIAVAVSLLPGVRLRQAVIPALSTVFLIAGGWFASAGLINAGGNAIRKITNIDSIIDYKHKKYLAEHADETDDAIRLENSEVYRLPDGNRLVHLAFTVDPALTVYDFSLRVPRSDRPETHWINAIGQCYTEGRFHLMNVLVDANWFELKTVWQWPDGNSMVKFQRHFEFPDQPGLPQLQVQVSRNAIEVPVPVPKGFLNLHPVGARPHEGINYGKRYGEGQYGQFSKACAYSPIRVDVDLASATLTFYSTERYKHMNYDFYAQATD